MVSIDLNRFYGFQWLSIYSFKQRTTRDVLNNLLNFILFYSTFTNTITLNKRVRGHRILATYLTVVKHNRHKCSKRSKVSQLIQLKWTLPCLQFLNGQKVVLYSQVFSWSLIPPLFVLKEHPNPLKLQEWLAISINCVITTLWLSSLILLLHIGQDHTFSLQGLQIICPLIQPKREAFLKKHEN